MTKRTIKKPPPTGVDTIHWMEGERPRSAKADAAASMLDLHSAGLARVPRKFKGQSNYHGRIWMAGPEASVWHESMTEYSGLMLIDHLHDIRAITPQPMLITFADGRTHYPDFFAVHRNERRTVFDVHTRAMTDAAAEATFDATRRLCEGIGWRYELLHELDDTTKFNLEWIAAFRHWRNAPDETVRAMLLAAVEARPTFGELRTAIRTDKPGEHLDALYHHMWHREVGFDLHTPFTDRTPLWKGNPDD